MQFQLYELKKWLLVILKPNDDNKFIEKYGDENTLI